jgi:hypothetical protein
MRAASTATNSAAVWGPRIAGWIAPSVLAIVLAFVSSYFGIQKGQALTDQRLTSAEGSIERNKQERDRAIDDLRSQSVPRSEHEARWKAEDEFRRLLFKSLDELKADVRELRTSPR